MRGACCGAILMVLVSCGDDDCCAVVDDAAILAGLADRVLLAVRWGSTRLEAMRIAVTRLREAASGVIGVVLTAVNPRTATAAGYRDAHYYMMTAHGYHLN